MKTKGKRIWAVMVDCCSSMYTKQLMSAISKALNVRNIKHAIRCRDYDATFDVYSIDDMLTVMRVFQIISKIETFDIDEISAEIITVF